MDPSNKNDRQQSPSDVASAKAMALADMIFERSDFNLRVGDLWSDAAKELSAYVLSRNGAVVSEAPLSAAAPDGPFHVSRSSDGERDRFGARDAATGVSIPANDRDQAYALVSSLNRAFSHHLRMTSPEIAVDTSTSINDERHAKIVALLDGHQRQLGWEGDHAKTHSRLADEIVALAPAVEGDVDVRHLRDVAHDAGVALSAILDKPEDETRHRHARHYLERLKSALREPAVEAPTTVSEVNARIGRLESAQRNAVRLLSLMDGEKSDRHTLTYTNYRGETSDRELRPVRIWFGGTDWHPEPQLLLHAFDYGKDAYRDFAVADFAIESGASASKTENE